LFYLLGGLDLGVTCNGQFCPLSWCKRARERERVGKQNWREQEERKTEYRVTERGSPRGVDLDTLEQRCRGAAGELYGPGEL
jgi:hypothetical protein